MEISHLEFGEKGKIIVFLHGWQQDKRSLVALVPFLYKDYRLIFLDLPGFGKSPLPATHPDSEEYAKIVFDWLKEKNLLPTILVGHSFGGKIAALMAHSYPQLISRLILIAPSGIPHKQPLKKLKNIAPAPLKKLISPLFQSRDYKNAGKLLSVFKRVVNEDLRPILPSLKTPTLIIWGENDTELSLKDAKLIHQLIPRNRLEILSGGHFLFHQHPEKVATVIKQFLKNEVT